MSYFLLCNITNVGSSVLIEVTYCSLQKHFQNEFLIISLPSLSVSELHHHHHHIQQRQHTTYCVLTATKPSGHLQAVS